MLSGRGLCDGLITRPEESYPLWCVVVCDLENPKNEEAIASDWAASAIGKKQICVLTSTHSLHRHACIPNFRAASPKKTIISHFHSYVLW